MASDPLVFTSSCLIVVPMSFFSSIGPTADPWLAIITKMCKTVTKVLELTVGGLVAKIFCRFSSTSGFATSLNLFISFLYDSANLDNARQALSELFLSSCTSLEDNVDNASVTCTNSSGKRFWQQFDVIDNAFLCAVMLKTTNEVIIGTIL